MRQIAGNTLRGHLETMVLSVLEEGNAHGFEQFARVGKALASPKRLELVDLLAQGERTVDALARAAYLGVTSCSAPSRTAASLVQSRQFNSQISGVVCKTTSI